MSFDDWMLALHLLSAFAWVAGVIVFWILIYAVRKTDSAEETIRMEPIATVGNVAVGVGMVGTVVLGLWLAFSIGGYDIWNGWIIAALVLWVISLPLGRRRRPAAAGRQGLRASQGDAGLSLVLLAANLVAVWAMGGKP